MDIHFLDRELIKHVRQEIKNPTMRRNSRHSITSVHVTQLFWLYMLMHVNIGAYDTQCR